MMCLWFFTDQRHTVPEPMREQKRQELGKFILGKTDEETLAAIPAQKVRNVLTQLFSALSGAFVPERAAGKQTVIQYDIRAGDALHKYQMEISAGACRVYEGTPQAAKITLSLSLPDLLRLVSDQLTGPQLFIMGKLSIQGDMGVAMVMQDWFQLGSNP